MDRLLRKVIVVAALGLLVASVAAANVPVPELSNVPRCLAISPTGTLAYKVTIVGTGGPINASSVEVRFTSVADTLICWCSPRPTPRPPSFFASTNASGVATFNIHGGGCIAYNLAAIPGPKKYAAEVFADNVKMQECGTVSPDAVDASGRTPISAANGVWDPAGVCATGLADAVQHTTPLATSTYEWCTDITCDKLCGLPDAVVLTTYLAGAASCAGDAAP